MTARISEHRLIYWILCLLLLAPVIYSVASKPWSIRSDLWETAAAIRAVSDDIANPINPLLDLPGRTSPRFTPYVIFWGAIMRLFGAGLFTIVALAGIANYFLFVSGLERLARRQFKDEQLPWVLLLVMLTVWGTGYGQANAYQFRMFLNTLPLVGFFTYGIAFHALACLRNYLDSQKRPPLIGYIILSILAFLTHPITALFLFAAALAMLVAEKNWKQVLVLQAVPLGSFFIALLWPYFSYWDVLTNGSSESWFDAPMFANQFQALGPALIGIFIIAWFARRKQHIFVTLGFIACAAVYLFSWAAQILIGSRFLLFATIFLHIAIALYLIEAWPAWKKISFADPKSLLVPLLILVILLPGLRFRAGEVRNLARDAMTTLSGGKLKTVYSQYVFLRERLKPTDVVLAEEDTAWPIPAITGARIVSQQKGDPLISGEIERRRRDVHEFFHSSESADPWRQIVSRYHVSHILLDYRRAADWNPHVNATIPVIADAVAAQDSLVLYRVSKHRVR